MFYTAITRAKSECVALSHDLASLRSVVNRSLELDKRHSVFDSLLAQMMGPSHAQAQAQSYTTH